MFCRSLNNGTPSLMFLLQVTLLIGFPLTVVAFSSSGCLDFCYHTRQNIKYAKSQPHRHYRTLTKILHPPRSVSPKNPFASTSSSSSTSLFAVSIDDRQAEQKSDMTATPTKIDNRPHEQRAKGPRLARRMNHGFKYLYRYNATNDLQDMTAFEYLSKYYTEDVIVEMNQTFPPLLNLSVSRHLHPKMRFLQETLGLAIDKVSMIPPQYFGARLERIIAPRHAFLKFMNLPYGRELIDDPQKWKDFLLSCRTTKRFCALCNQWRREIDNGVNTAQIISKQIEAFDTIFGRGALAASRNELCQHNNTWPLQQINIASGQLLELLIEHGANPFERDNRGVSLLHWACGTGNLDACTVLLKYFTNFEELQTERDGATPLHWAVAGANSREFGTGGHIDICRYLLNVSNDPKNFVNKLTHDGNSPLMWASWSGTLDTTKLMIRNRADPTVANRNGCTCAHWAASGGNLEICKYLQSTVNVDFFQPNYGGNTPLTHAVAFGHIEIVKWLRDQVDANDEDDIAALSLAEDFYTWTDGEDVRRRQVLQLFRDDYFFDSLVTTEDVEDNSPDPDDSFF